MWSLCEYVQDTGGLVEAIKYQKDHSKISGEIELILESSKSAVESFDSTETQENLEEGTLPRLLYFPCFFLLPLQEEEFYYRDIEM